MPAPETIAYHPYIAFIAEFDHTASIRLHPDARHEPLLLIADRFTEDCWKVRAQLAASHATMGPQRAADAGLEAASDPFAPHLFSPLCFAAIGRTDDLAIVLLDNLPLAIRLTAVNRVMEGADVAFCPRVDTFHLNPEIQARLQAKGLIGESSNKTWPFFDLHELVVLEGAEAGSARDWSRKDALPTPLRDTPLCIVSRFKLNTLLSLGHGVLLQQAVLEAMADTIRRTCLAFLDDAGTNVRGFVQPLLAYEDIASLKCVFLEPQGAEDIAVLIFCSNYSVAEMLITALRNLTIADILESAGNPIRALLGDERSGSLHLQVARHVTENQKAGLDSIQGNHVFMTSYSTLCVAHHAMRDPDQAGVHGWVEAYVNIDTKPGHEREIRERLSAVYDDVLGSAIAWESSSDLGRIAFRVLPGLHDEIVNLRVHAANETERFGPGSVVRTADVLRFLFRFFSHEGARPAGSPETGFLDLSTSLVVPIPRVERDREGAVRNPDSEAIAAQIPKGETLPPVDWAHHLHGVQLFRELRQAVEGQFALGDSLALRDQLRAIGCPSSWQYSLAYLFEEFLACIEDPMRCVGVLDLYECFAALASLIREELPAYLTGISDPLRRRRERSLLFEKGLIADFIAGLQESFALRLERAIPHHETRDTAFLLRGGVSKFLSAMDVPVKCSLGLFRRMFGLTPEEINETAFKQRFAAVTSVCLGRQTRSQFGCFCKEEILFELPKNLGDFPVYLATFDIDVMRLYAPEQIIHFIHEFAHFYFDTFIAVSLSDFERDYTCQEDLKGIFSAKDATEYVHMSTAEIFAELITHLFVFKGDTELFSKFYGLSFSEVQESVFEEVRSDADARLIERIADGLIEALYRAFLVVDLVGQIDSHAERPVAEWPDEHPAYVEGNELNTTDLAWIRFKKYIEDYGAFYRDYDLIWRSGEVADIWARSEARFRAWYSSPKQLTRLRLVWSKAVSVYVHFLSMLPLTPQLESSGSRPSDMKALGICIRECMKEGHSFLRMPAGVDPLIVVCESAYQYIRGVYGRLDSEKVVYVEGEAGRRSFDGREKYNDFLFHPDHFPLYCVDPSVRRERVLTQISFFRTLGDISSQLRARRFVDMLQLVKTA